MNERFLFFEDLSFEKKKKKLLDLSGKKKCNQKPVNPFFNKLNGCNL